MRGFDEVPDGRRQFQAVMRLAMLIFGSIVLFSGFFAVAGRIYLSQLNHTGVSNSSSQSFIGQGIEDIQHFPDTHNSLSARSHHVILELPDKNDSTLARSVETDLQVPNVNDSTADRSNSQASNANVSESASILGTPLQSATTAESMLAQFDHTQQQGIPQTTSVTYANIEQGTQTVLQLIKQRALHLHNANDSTSADSGRTEQQRGLSQQEPASYLHITHGIRNVLQILRAMGARFHSANDSTSAHSRRTEQHRGIAQNEPVSHLDLGQGIGRILQLLKKNILFNVTRSSSAHSRYNKQQRGLPLAEAALHLYTEQRNTAKLQQLPSTYDASSAPSRHTEQKRAISQVESASHSHIDQDIGDMLQFSNRTNSTLPHFRGTESQRVTPLTDKLNDFVSCWTPYVKGADSTWDELKVYDQAIVHCQDTAKRFYKSVSSGDGYKAWLHKARKALASAKVRSAYVASNLFSPQTPTPRPCPSSYTDNEKPHVVSSNISQPLHVIDYLQRRDAIIAAKKDSPLDTFVQCWAKHTHLDCTGTELDRFDDAVASCEEVARGFYDWASSARGFKEFSGFARHDLATSLLRYYGPGATADRVLCTSKISAGAALDLFHPSRDRSWECQRPAVLRVRGAQLCDPREKRGVQPYWVFRWRRPEGFLVVAGWVLLAVAVCFGALCLEQWRRIRGVAPPGGPPKKLSRRQRRNARLLG
ncbi:hypothetical protein MMC16_007760 [Acarospora aff. strigata]|nr:hypothetical protein [Acarospora aff. strigata]